MKDIITTKFTQNTMYVQLGCTIQTDKPAWCLLLIHSKSIQIHKRAKMRKTISKRIGVMTSDDDLLDNPLGNQATIINNSIVIDNLNKFRSKQNTSNTQIVHQNPDAKLPSMHSTKLASNHSMHYIHGHNTKTHRRRTQFKNHSTNSMKKKTS